MYSLEPLKIDLRSLQGDLAAMEYDLDDAYFEAIGATEVSGGKVHVDVALRRSAGFFELTISTAGVVRVACDRCLDEMEQPIETTDRLVVKYGTGDSEDDELVLVDEEEAVLDLSWLIYELLAVAIPVRHVHEEGQCNDEMLRTLSQYTAEPAAAGEEETLVDSRWEALLRLKENNQS